MASMGEGLFALDSEGRLTYMNPAAERLLGWKAEELLGRPIHDHIHYVHPDGCRPSRPRSAPSSGAGRRRSLRNHEDVFVRKDGDALSRGVQLRPHRLRRRPAGGWSSCSAT